MRIVKITTHENTKLIAAQRLFRLAGYDTPGCTIFFDYSDGVLKEYAGNEFKPTNAATFKDALKHIKSL